jgi:hypothetical protein
MSEYLVTNGLPTEFVRAGEIYDDDNSAGDPIAIDMEVPGYLKVEGIYIKMSAVPTTAGLWTFERISTHSIGGHFDTTILELDFVALGVSEYVSWGPCCAWPFHKGDHFKVDYPNPDSLTIGCTIMLFQPNVNPEKQFDWTRP